MRAFPIECDDHWLAEWVTFGLQEFEAYLDKHRRFDDYYHHRSRSAALRTVAWT